MSRRGSRVLVLQARYRFGAGHVHVLVLLPMNSQGHCMVVVGKHFAFFAYCGLAGNPHLTAKI